jgi:nitrous oxide reductase accessory protein NosL
MKSRFLFTGLGFLMTTCILAGCPNSVDDDPPLPLPLINRMWRALLTRFLIPR